MSKPTNVVYAVFIENWEYDNKPVLDSLFYEKTDADTYAEELRNKIHPNWNLSSTNRVHYMVTVEEREIL